jgi:CheY-like chemotaxis protein
MTQVFIVEDDPDIRATLRLLLDDAGYTYSEAPDGGSALEVLRASAEPLIVLLDLMLPVLSGTDLLAALADDPVAGPRHAYILLTAKRDVFTPEMGSIQERLPISLVQKPFDIDEVIAAIDSAAAQLMQRG